MDFETRFPVLQRELRLALRRGGSWRTSWKGMAAALFGALVLLLLLKAGSGQLWLNSIQVIGGLSAVVVASMPVGFVRDREAGQQSLLRLTGLGPLRVFAESAFGSLWAALQFGLYGMPVVLAGMVWFRIPYHRAFLVSLLPASLLLLLASVWILAVTASRTRSGAGLLSVLIAAVLVVPIVAHHFAGAYLPSASQEVLGILWGADSWGRLDDIFHPRSPVSAFVSCLVRIGLLSAFLLAAAAMFYCRDWRRAESDGSHRRGGSGRLPFLLAGAGHHRQTEGNPYRVRYPAPGGWRRIRWLLAALVLGLGVTGAAAWSWMALPVALTLWCSVVDLAAHVVVSEVVAQDRREGAFELLFTTPLPPGDVLNAGNQVGRGMVRDGIRPGLILAAAFAFLTWRMAGSDLFANITEAMTHLSVWALPVAYFAALYHLPFRLPASQSANTGEPFHAFSMPQTAFFMPMITGFVAFGMSIATGHFRIGVALIALMMVIVILIVRESVASDQPLSDEELRTVAAAPLPTLDLIPKDTRTTTPWIPEGFRR